MTPSELLDPATSKANSACGFLSYKKSNYVGMWCLCVCIMVIVAVVLIFLLMPL